MASPPLISPWSTIQEICLEELPINDLKEELIKNQNLDDVSRNRVGRRYKQGDVEWLRALRGSGVVGSTNSGGESGNPTIKTQKSVKVITQNQNDRSFEGSLVPTQMDLLLNLIS